MAVNVGVATGTSVAARCEISVYRKGHHLNSFYGLLRGICSLLAATLGFIAA